MTENNEYNATPEATPSIEEQVATKRKAVIEELTNLDWGYRYLDSEHPYQILEHTVKVIKGKVEARKALTTAIDEWVDSQDGEFAEQTRALLDILEDSLSLDAYTNKSIDIEITATVYVSRKKWEADEDIDIEDIGVTLEGNYGLEIDDYSIDSIREG
jgi:hypothetical protein